MSEKYCWGLMVLTVFCLFCIVPVIAETSTNYWAPWVTNTNTTSATINWRGESSGSGLIDYATSSYYNTHHNYEKTIASPDITRYQHVQLNGLEPNTSYIYRVRPSGNEDVFANRMFRTMPVSGPFTFVVISDSQEGHNYTEWMRFKYVADAVANETDVLFILHGGDYAGHDSQDLWATYFQVADGMLAKTAIFTTIGNHEYHNSSGDTPTNAYQYHSSYHNPLNYSFDCANVRFIVLNSPDPDSANGDDPHTSLALAMSQEAWLNEQLDNNLSGTFTIHHHPIWDYYSSTNNPNLQPWETLYHAYNISATFSGHTHNYQRYSVMGIPYFIVGDAGGRCADLISNNTPPVWYQFGEAKVLGYLKVTVDPENNIATAQEIFVASVKEDDSNETPTVYNPPVIADTIVFPLKVNQTLPEPSGIPITAPAVISTPGHYRLTNDLSNSTANTAILITASDVILDGGGHTLNGALAFNTTGVLAGDLPGNLSNITIINLTVTGWEYGFLIEGVENSSLNNICANGNNGGISITRSPSFIIDGCTIGNNIPLMEEGISFGGSGVVVDNSSDIRILDSNISDNGWSDNPPFVGGYGIILSHSPGSLISGCVINKNINTGIWNQQSLDLRVLGNEIHNNTGNGGIFMTSKGGAMVMNCTIADNNVSGSGWGIWLERQDYLVKNNTVNSCGYGIFLENSSNATLTGNVMLNNEMNFGVDGQEIANYLHQVDTSNTVNGRPIYYLVNQSGSVVDGATRAGTVFGISCPNLTIRDLTLENNEYGVFLLESNGAVIRNVTATGNSNGFSITKSDNPSIETCTAHANTNKGFLVQDSDGLQITDSDAFMNTGERDAGTGIAIGNCQDILLWNVTANQNNFAGIDLEGTDRASLVNVTAGENTVVGMILGGGSIQVTGCHIQDNQGPGIGMLDSTNVTMWNNFFSNDENIDLSSGVVTGSFWNIQKTAGTNIVSGSFLGGNYWAKPDGSGWSQITPDRGDGFCNAPFVIDANNTDYLPLHFTTQSSNVGVFRDGTFFLAASNTNGGGNVSYFNFGQEGDVPVAGKWSGSGTTTVGIFRTGNFYLASSNTPGGGTVNAFNFGQEGDVPVAGKWSGSGAATVGIFRTGNFFLASTNTPGGGTVNAFNFGQEGDVPVAGDWTGSGTTTVGIFRTGNFFLASSNIPGGGTVNAFNFGQAGDVPVVGDWNGDGKTEVGIFRNGAFYLASRNENGGGTVIAFTFGMIGDVPVAGRWT